MPISIIEVYSGNILHLFTYHKVLRNQGLLTPGKPNGASHVQVSIHVRVFPR